MCDGCLPRGFQRAGVQFGTESGGRGGKFATFDSWRQLQGGGQMKGTMANPRRPMLDIDGTQHVPVGRSTLEGSDSEVWEGTKIG